MDLYLDEMAKKIRDEINSSTKATIKPPPKVPSKFVIDGRTGKMRINKRSDNFGSL